MAKKTSIDYFRNAVSSIRGRTERVSVYCFYGEESYFLDRLQDEAISLVPESQRDFNLDLLYGADVTPGQLLSIAKSYPMMAELRVVILRDFRRLSFAEDGNPEDLVAYLENPNPTTILVLIDEKSPDKRSRMGKMLTGKTPPGIFSAEFENLPEYQVPDWISGWVKEHYDKQIDPDSARILSQLAGNQLQRLSTELEKVCTFVDSRKQIARSDVEAIIGSYREYSVFELKDAVLSRDLEQTLSILEQMLLKGKTDTGEVIRTVGFFYSVFSNIWQILRLKEKGLNKSQIQQELNVKSTWYFNQLWKDATSFRLSEMPAVFEALLDADRAGKGYTTLDPSTILLLMVKRIVG